MIADEERNNRQFQLMLKPARERLSAYTPEELCRKGGLSFDYKTNCFLFPTLGRTLSISYPNFILEEKLNPWHHLTILQYMDTADGSPLNGSLISLTDMPGGLSRGHGINKDIETMFARWFVGVSAAEFASACQRLGGTILDGKADVVAHIPYAPHFPITLTFYEGDEEFPPSGKALIDKNAHHYLGIEGAGGACASVVQMLAELISKNSIETNRGETL